MAMISNCTPTGPKGLDCCVVSYCQAPRFSVAMKIFPKDPNIRELWLKIIKREDLIGYKGKLLICESHFAAEMFTENRRLRVTAIPLDTQTIEKYITHNKKVVEAIGNKKAVGADILVQHSRIDDNRTQITQWLLERTWQESEWKRRIKDVQHLLTNELDIGPNPNFSVQACVDSSTQTEKSIFKNHLRRKWLRKRRKRYA